MKIKKLLPLIGIILFIYIISRIGLKDIFIILKQGNINLILISLIFLIPIVLMQTYKWSYFLKRQGIKLLFSERLKLQLIGMFYGFLTPSRIGSLIKIYYLRDKLNIDFGKSSLSVVMDRLMDTISVLLLAIVGSLLLIHHFTNLYIVVILVFILFATISYIFMNRNISRYFLKKVYKHLLPKKLKSEARYSFHSFYDDLPKVKKLVVPLILNLITWILLFTRGFFVALAFSVYVPYFYYITIIPIATIVSLIPITISGFGTREATLITLFSIFNIEPAKVVTFSVISYLLSNIPAFFGLFFATKKAK